MALPVNSIGKEFATSNLTRPLNATSQIPSQSVGLMDLGNDTLFAEIFTNFNNQHTALIV